MSHLEALQQLCHLQKEKIEHLERLIDELTEKKWKKVSEQYGIQEEFFYGSPNVNE